MTKILLAEDDIFLQKISKTKLEKEGYTVLAVDDGQQAIDALPEKPDLILLDVIMPLKNGFDVLEVIRKNKDFNSVPVLMLTTLIQESDIEKAKKMGANDYIDKPNTSIPEILELVKKHLERGAQ